MTLKLETNREAKKKKKSWIQKCVYYALDHHFDVVM